MLVTKCPACEYEVFGCDNDGHFCWNCGHAIEAGSTFYPSAVMHVPEDGGSQTPPVKKEEEEMVKRVPKGATPAAKKAQPKNRAQSKAPAKKATRGRKAPVKKDGPKEDTAEYYALHGKKDGVPKLEDEKHGEVINGFLAGLLHKNLVNQNKGQWKRMLTNTQIAEKFMAKYPGRNFQAISAYMSYFNRGKIDPDVLLSGTDEALRPRSYWERMDRIEKEEKAKARRKK